MHIGPLPESSTQYDVYALYQHVDGGKRDLYMKVSPLAWPHRTMAEAFQQSYEDTHPQYEGKTVIIEKHTTWTRISDYANDKGQGRKIPSQRGLQRQREGSSTVRNG